MSNADATSGSTDRRLRVPRLLMVISALLLFGAIGYFSTRETSPAPSAEVPKDLAARFEAVEGNVKTRAVGGLDWKTASVNVPLRRNDLVRTYPSSSAEIKFFDDTRVTVRPDSLITIEETSRDPASASSRVAWKVTSGEINYETSRRGTGSTEAVTPTFRLALEGNSAGTMRVGDNGQAAVAQLTGSASLRTKTGEAIRLGANEGIKIDASGKAGAKQALPSIPVPNRPGGAEGILVLPEGEPVPVSWAAAAGAAGYRLQVEAVAPGGREVVFDKNDVKGTNANPSGVTTGDFMFRVAALTSDGVQGRFSDPVAFKVERSVPARTVIANAPPPALVIEVFEARSNVVRLAGKTEPGARLTVNGDVVTVQANGAFSGFFTLARTQGEQRVVIRATSSAGGVAEETRSLTAGR